MTEQVLCSKEFSKVVDGRKIKVQAQIAYIQGNSSPHFSITGQSGDVGAKYDTFGCIHDEIESAFPELAKYIAFHLCDNEGTPMYYYENSLYHLKTGNWDGFKSCSNYGLLESDYNFQVENLGEYGYMFLNSRLADIQREYRSAMTELFGDANFLKSVKFTLRVIEARLKKLA